MSRALANSAQVLKHREYLRSNTSPEAYRAITGMCRDLILARQEEVSIPMLETAIDLGMAFVEDGRRDLAPWAMAAVADMIEEGVA